MLNRIPLKFVCLKNFYWCTWLCLLKTQEVIVQLMEDTPNITKSALHMTTLPGSLLTAFEFCQYPFKESVPHNGMKFKQHNNDFLCFEQAILLIYSFLKLFYSPRQLYLQ